jgi:hypothetical protein
VWLYSTPQASKRTYLRPDDGPSVRREELGVWLYKLVSTRTCVLMMDHLRAGRRG